MESLQAKTARLLGYVAQPVGGGYWVVINTAVNFTFQQYYPYADFGVNILDSTMVRASMGKDFGVDLDGL
jgi:hypothetical protein